MGNLYESKFMKSLQKFGENIAGNKTFSAITSGMMLSLGVILASAIFQLIAILPTMFKWVTTDSAFYKLFMLPYNMTMGLISLVVVIGIAYAYAKSLGLKPLVNTINALLLFLMVAAPATTVQLADGISNFNGLDTSALGGSGLFTAILIAILSVKLAHFFQKHKITVRMPDVVPQSLQDSFTSIIPLVVNILLWHGINTLVLKGTSVSIPLAITNILSAPLGALTSVPGMAILLFIALLLWSFGIHGTMVMNIVLMPSLIQYMTNNAALVADGKAAVFAPVALYGALMVCGGTGNTFSLIIMGLRSKSEQIKAVSKAALLPGIFNINEPVTFGFPIMFNPILAIPFILNPIIILFLMWIGFEINFFQPSYIMIFSSLPMGVSESLGAMSWHNIFMPVLGFIVSFIIYRPFFKVYERQLIEKENATKEIEKSEVV